MITGAARGIGAATARLLAGRGDRVAIADIDGDMAVTIADELGEHCQGYKLDVSDRLAFIDFVDQVETNLGPIDVMINNAGIAMASPQVTDQEIEVIEKSIDVNLKGVIWGTLVAVEKMRPRGHGAVINVASLAGVIGVPGLAVYSASKFGVVGFTEGIRAEQEDSGISFTVVMPGPVETDMMVGTRSAPLVRLVKPEVLAAAIVGAIETGKPRVAVPRSTGAYVRLMSILPPKFAIRMNRLMGLDRVSTEIDPAARSEYVERIKRTIS
ncbi:MAG: SDR family oxidoreductase [Solirubrobacterales bacterium]|nr:SDR family oxidoreductase [Solirubrobacterales bacterium]